MLVVPPGTKFEELLARDREPQQAAGAAGTSAATHFVWIKPVEQVLAHRSSEEWHPFDGDLREESQAV